MDAFEQIVAKVFELDGYWVYTNYKIKLGKKQKAELGKPSMPRPEIDVLAYRPVENRLIWVECKSYLDSRGVKFASIDEGSPRFRIFTDPKFREIVSEELLCQLSKVGLIRSNPTMQYALVAGHIATESDRNELNKYFKEQGWQFYDDQWIKGKLENLRELDYENHVIVILTKILRANEISNPTH